MAELFKRFFYSFQRSRPNLVELYLCQIWSSLASIECNDCLEFQNMKIFHQFLKMIHRWQVKCATFSTIHSDQHIHQPTFQLLSRSNLVIIKSLPFRTTTMSSHWMSLKTWPIDDREAPRLWWSNFNSQIPWFGSICLPILKGFVCSRGMGLLLSLMIVIFDAKNILYAEPESINTIWLSQNCEM